MKTLLLSLLVLSATATHSAPSASVSPLAHSAKSEENLFYKQVYWSGPTSPFLKQVLDANFAKQKSGGSLAVAVYSLRYHRFEVELNAGKPLLETSKLLPLAQKYLRADSTKNKSGANLTLHDLALKLAETGRSNPKTSLPIFTFRKPFQNKPIDLKNFLWSDIPARKKQSSQLSGVGYLIGSDGDTLAFVLALSGYTSKRGAALQSLEGLRWRVIQWFNKEAPALAMADALLHLPKVPSGYPERLEFFSHALEGKPYFLGPTGEGRFDSLDSLPLTDLGRFDCVTYLETVLALARSKDGGDFLAHLLPIRYHSDTLSFLNRNHYFVLDWLAHNTKVAVIHRFPGDSTLAKPIDKLAFFKSKGLHYPAENPLAHITYLPLSKALNLAGDLNQGKRMLGVAFLANKPGLDVTHTGFLLFRPGQKALMRHAGLGKGKVVTESFAAYLEGRNGKLPGVVLFDFSNPVK